MTDNPFRIGVAVRGAFFTNRADETARVADPLREGGARLLVVGERRVGKTSVLLRSIERVQRGSSVADGNTALAQIVVPQPSGRIGGKVISDGLHHAGISV